MLPHRFANSKPRPSLKKRRRLRLESLESRRLLTVIVDPYWPTQGTVDDTATIKMGDQARIDLLANDHNPWGVWHSTPHRHVPDLTPEELIFIDVDFPSTRFLRFDPPELPEIDSVGDPENGTVQLLADGRTLIYTPDEGFAGIEQFTYVGIRQSGETYEAAVTINVVAPTVAVPDWFHVQQGQTDVMLDVTANDGSNIDQSYDFPWHTVDSDPVLKITSVDSASSGGKLSISDDGSLLTYTPADDFTGLETIAYTIEDENGFTTSTFVDIRVTQAGEYDTGEWSQWWKHQIIAASLESNHGYGQQIGAIRMFHDNFAHRRLAETFVERAAWLTPESADTDMWVANTFSTGGTYTNTNIQVAGVNQGDLVKTDGRYIYVVTPGLGASTSQLAIFDAEDANALPLIGRITFDGTPQELHLLDDSILVVSNSAAGVRVTTIGLSDRSSPVVIGSTEVPGNFLESRMVDGVVQIYTTLYSHHYEVLLGSVCAADSTTCFNETRQQLIDRILGDETLRQVPSIDHFDAEGTSSDKSVIRPFVGRLDSSVLLVGALFDGSAASAQVLGSAQSATIYVNQDNVYVFGQTSGNAGLAWNSGWLIDFPADNMLTDVNQYQVSGVQWTWTASGQFEGDLLNSHSVGDHDGYLYVAVGTAEFSSRVLVLQQDGQLLSVIGQTEPLAPGERIYSTRFVDDRAYVVTFRQIDPLFTVDLSNPEQPTVTNELKMPGFSQYLHSIGDQLLIGVGRETDDWGRVLGMEISLFDVSDPANVVISDKLPLGQLSSPLAEGNRFLSDHRAFGYYDSHQILALPVYPNWLDGTPRRSSVLLVRVDSETGLTEIGQIEFEDSQVLRTFRIGDVLYSVSSTEIQAHSFSDPSSPLVKRSLRDLPELAEPTTTPVEPPVDPPATPVDPPTVDPPGTPQPQQTMVRIAPHFVDGNGNAIETVHSGQTVWLEVTAADVRAMRQLGVFSSYVDIDFGDASVEIVGDSEFSDAFWVQRRDPADHGWANVGATQGLSSEADPSRPWVLRTPIRFTTSGEFTVGLAQASNPRFETLLYGLDHVIPLASIEFTTASVTVTESRDPMDVSRDGQITLVDPLMIINRLMERSESPDATIDTDRYDVNGDGEMTAGDIIILINYIENQRVQDQAIAEVLEEDDDDEPLLEAESVLF